MLFSSLCSIEFNELGSFHNSIFQQEDDGNYSICGQHDLGSPLQGITMFKDTLFKDI